MSIENNSTIEQSGNMPKGGEQSIPKGWVETTLGEVVSKIIDYRGKTPKKLGENWSINGKYRALSAKSVKTGGLTNLDQINRVNEILYKKWMKDEIQLNDILMT
jgi:type I restriction enzyme S subunit